MKEIRLNTGETVLCDDDDFEMLSTFSWYRVLPTKRCRHTYVRTCITKNGKRHSIMMHRMVMRVYDSKIMIDHINNNSLDNRKCNLRVCSNSENLRNTRKRVNNKSGYKGVHWDKVKGMYRASIMHYRRKIQLGCFKDPAEAHKAYIEASKKLHGEFARAE